MGDTTENLDATWAPYRCPKCRRCDSIPMPRVKLFDIAVGSVGLGPYKCRACRHKYYRRSLHAMPVEEPDEPVLDWAEFVRNPRPVLVTPATTAPIPDVTPTVVAASAAHAPTSHASNWVAPIVAPDRSQTKQRLDHLIRSAEDRRRKA